LRSPEAPNEYLAKDLTEQVQARLEKKAKMPVMIPLAGLEIANDSDSNYGLAFKLKEDSELIYAPILNKDGRFSSEDIDFKTGLPKKLGNGNRNSYTRESGLSRLDLGGGLDLYSDWDVDSLDGSNGGGRVVVVSAAGASQKIDSYVSKLEAEKDAQIKAIESKYQKALDVLKSK